MVSGTFAKRFERVYGALPLPKVYRAFVLSGAYERFARAYLRGLLGYGDSDIEVRLDSARLLKKALLFEGAGIDDRADGFHPVAVVPGSAEFLAIDVTRAEAPVFLCRHDSGAFHPQFDSFDAFLAALRLPRDVSRERREQRAMFAAIRRTCGAAAVAARAALERGDLDGADAALDRALANRSPVTYDGRNDFTAIGLLCACYVLRGRVCLARRDLPGARAAFLDATDCGGHPYWEAAVDLAITSFLIGDPGPADARLGRLDRSDFPIAPMVIALAHFTPPQVDEVVRRLDAWPGEDPYRPLAVRVQSWLAAAPEA